MKKHLLLAAAAAATLTAAPAFAQAYSGGTGSFTGLGSDPVAYPGTPFDTVNLAPIAGVYGNPGTYNFNAVTFLSGFNRNDNASFTGVLSGLTGTFNGANFSYNVNYSLDINATDTIILGGNKFNVGGTTVLINPLTLNAGPGAPATGTLTVSTGSAVPEPATWAMMMLGFGMIGFGLRRRAKQTVRVTYA